MKMNKKRFVIEILCDPQPALTAIGLLAKAPKEVIHRASRLLQAPKKAFLLKNNYHFARGAGQIVISLNPANSFSKLVSASTCNGYPA